MKKNVLSEEISRIKNIIGKVMNESFDDMDDEFDTEEDPLDYDETDDYQDDFSPKLKQKQLKNKMKLDVNYGVPSYSEDYIGDDLLYKEKINDYKRDKRDYGYSVEHPKPPKETGKPIEPYNPIQSTDIPLEKYLSLKRDATFRGDNKIKYK
jgi:hypothetical protein